jgi:hypothetical protein
MGRTIGAKNVQAFENRHKVETSNGDQVRHLADIKGTPLQEFVGLLQHQKRFVDWVDSRHSTIVDLKADIDQLNGLQKRSGPRGAKNATFVKYRWYAQQLIMLEAVNAFETFYKKTFVALGTVLRDYIKAEVFKDYRIDATVVWSTAGIVSAPVLIFEQGLYHDLEAIDKATQALVRQRRYNQQDPKSAISKRITALRIIFQVRHTLSHNNGMVTDGDAAKFRRLGFAVNAGEIIDPAKDNFGLAILKQLQTEAGDFTDWLARAVHEFLNSQVEQGNLLIPYTKKKEMIEILGEHDCWKHVMWYRNSNM